MKYSNKRWIIFIILSVVLWMTTAVIHYFVPEQMRVGNLIFLIWCIAALGMTVVVGFFLESDTDGSRKQKREDLSHIDELTGLPNRNYFKEAYGEQSVFNTLRYKTVAVFDIDSFKEANDTMNGDDVLRSVAECARRIIGEQGEIFRWGGDEFMVLMEWSMEFAYEICREFCKEVEKGGRVTVSVGVTEVKMSDTIKRNYYRAAQGCYLVKEMGGNGVKRN